MDQSFTKRGLTKEAKTSLQESWLCQPWTVLSWQVYSPQDNGCFSETQSQNLFLQLMTAVAYMHLCSQKVGRWLSFAMGIWWSMLNMWWEIVDPKSLQNQEMPRFSDEISADICFHLTFPFQKTPRVETPEALQEGNSQRHQGRKSIHFVSRYRLVYGWRIWDHWWSFRTCRNVVWTSLLWWLSRYLVSWWNKPHDLSPSMGFEQKSNFHEPRTSTKFRIFRPFPHIPHLFTGASSSQGSTLGWILTEENSHWL